MTPILTRFATATLVGLAACACARSEAAWAAEPIGTWATEDGRARVRTEWCPSDDAHLCGYIVWLKDPLDDDGKPIVDRLNPDGRKRARPTLGQQMLLGLKLNAEGRFEGKIYNGDNGKFYDVTVWSTRPSELSLKGCMLAVFCGSQDWARVADVAPGQLQGATDAPGGPRSDPELAAKPTTTGTLPTRGGRSPATPVSGLQ